MRDTREEIPGDLVVAAKQPLAVRSAALIVRGLRDLARNSNWQIQKVFTGRAANVAVAPGGQVITVGEGGARRAVLHDIEHNGTALTLPAPDGVALRGGNGATEKRAALAWSPTSASVVAAVDGWPNELYDFDVQGGRIVGQFGRFESFPERLTWSNRGSYFASASRGSRVARLRVWKTQTGEMPFRNVATAELGPPDWIERQTYEAEFGEEGAFRGYGATAFRPDERWLASVVEFRGEWADDSIAIVDLPEMKERRTFPAQGHITDLQWTSDGQQIVYCAAGQAYRLDTETMEAETLPFGAELSACHPDLPLAVFYSSWLKNSAKGRLFVVDLSQLAVFDEHAADSVADLRWSADGERAYAVTLDGLGYIYEPPLL
ncbi:MAG: WD40 repeat domain-containing protein [Candidatus Acidiferrales bacterium]